MTKRVFRAIMTVAGTVLLASLVLIMGFLYSYFGDLRDGQLRDALELAAAAVETDGAAYLETLGTDRYRLTWVAADGGVLYDTQASATEMGNHADRTEIQQALRTGEGSDSRYSATLLKKTVYHALALSDGTVLRISVSQATAGAVLLSLAQPVLLVLIAALILAGVLAGRVSRRITEPLNRLDLEHPLENDTYPELAPLLSRLSRQQKELADQLTRLRRQRDEFAQVTASMKEGLVLLDGQGCVLSINPAACGLFGAEPSCVGQSFVTVERRTEVSRAIDTALTEGHSESLLEQAGRVYRLDVSRVETEDAGGVVLLAFDVSEQEQAERHRREFTANVSHELKTPLQSIIGSAELLENELVKPEDVPRFIGRIRQEAARLVTLIEDIIRLSRLDEAGTLPTEPVELLSVAREVVDTLKDAAQTAGVTLRLDGSPVTVPGVRQLLYEVIYNLCDNAVKYNHPGGFVDVTVDAGERGAVLTVADTGCGIPPEHQSRVFERFYRVDRSRSKETGGTGLGLSIVKHAVARHHGDIALTSTPGEGTKIRITLPIA